jgi:hypothetical protein
MAVPLPEKIHARYAQAGRNILRLAEEEADALGEAIARSHSAMTAFAQFALAPQALGAVAVRGVLRRWLDLVPGFQAVGGLLARKSGQTAQIVPLSAAALAAIHAAVVGQAGGSMLVADAERYAAHVAAAASASFAHTQHCAAAQAFALNVLLAHLRVLFGEPLQHMAQARVLQLQFESGAA